MCIPARKYSKEAEIRPLRYWDRQRICISSRIKQLDRVGPPLVVASHVKKPNKQRKRKDLNVAPASGMVPCAEEYPDSSLITSVFIDRPELLSLNSDKAQLSVKYGDVVRIGTVPYGFDGVDNGVFMLTFDHKTKKKSWEPHDPDHLVDDHLFVVVPFASLHAHVGFDLLLKDFGARGVLSAKAARKARDLLYNTGTKTSKKVKVDQATEAQVKAMQTLKETDVNEFDRVALVPIRSPNYCVSFAKVAHAVQRRHGASAAMAVCLHSDAKALHFEHARHKTIVPDIQHAFINNLSTKESLRETLEKDSALENFDFLDTIIVLIGLSDPHPRFEGWALDNIGESKLDRLRIVAVGLFQEFLEEGVARPINIGDSARAAFRTALENRRRAGWCSCMEEEMELFRAVKHMYQAVYGEMVQPIWQHVIKAERHFLDRYEHDQEGGFAEAELRFSTGGTRPRSGSRRTI